MQINKKKNAFQKGCRPIMIKGDHQYNLFSISNVFLSLNRTAINQRLSADGHLHFIPGVKL